MRNRYNEYVEMYLYGRLGDVIELEIAIHLMIKKYERNSMDKYMNINEFYHSIAKTQ